MPARGRAGKEAGPKAAESPAGDLALARLAARAADEKRAENVVVYDLRGAADFADFFVVATAAAEGQQRAIARAIRARLREADERPLGVEGRGTGWALLDYGGCVVHLFSPDLRAYYDLDLLWGDCPRVDWEAKA